jgi:hypothetical protein
MEITEAWRVIAACVRKVYDNVKNIIHLVRRPPSCRSKCQYILDAGNNFYISKALKNH